MSLVRNGFYLDEEVLGGVSPLLSEEETDPPQFTAYQIAHASGEMVDFQVFDTESAAWKYLEALPRTWKFESLKNCDKENCGKNDSGSCAIGGCGRS